MRLGAPIYTPKLLRKYPNVLPKTAPRVKVGENTPAGIGLAIAKTMRMNFRKTNIIKLNPTLG